MNEKLVELMAEVLAVPREQVGDSLTMAETGAWDSLKHMELVVGIEELFGVELSADEIVAMRDVAAIRQILREKGHDA